MKQIALPGLEPVALPAEETPVPIEDGNEQTTFVADDRQLDLFADKVNLERNIDHALQAGDFETVLRLRDTHRESYGVSPATAGLAFLDALVSIGVAGPIGLLEVWEKVDQALRSQPALDRRVREGVLRRLLRSYAPADIVGARPSCLAPLVNFLTTEAVADGALASAVARRLVRDALLTGHVPAATEIQGDPGLRDLLGEDLSPQWLACLGAVRRLWPVPPATEAELRVFEGEDGIVTADDAGRFWLCLRVAETSARPERLLHEARRRMKRLSPDLHALYMSRVRRTEG